MANRRSLLLGGAGLILGGAGLAAGGGWRALRDSAEKGTDTLVDIVPTPAPSPTPPPFSLSNVDGSTLVSTDAVGWHSWTLVDHNDGAMTGSATQAEVARTCSVIKVWIAADYLRRNESASSTKRSLISKMIRNSDNNSASTLFSELGRIACFKRMQETCQLTDFTPGNSWGQCQMSTRDLARVAAGVAAGTAAGPKWTEWLLNEMRQVKLGKWGIREAFPPEEAAQIPIKNGWDTTSATQTRHMNCLAITPRWSLMVMTKYPVKYEGGDRHGQVICRDVTAQLLLREELEPLFKP